MSKTKFPVVTVPVNKRGLCIERCKASAGPNSNITGMRKFWGQDAPIVRCGRYIYLVSEQDYYYFKY